MGRMPGLPAIASPKATGLQRLRAPQDEKVSAGHGASLQYRRGAHPEGERAPAGGDHRQAAHGTEGVRHGGGTAASPSGTTR